LETGGTKEDPRWRVLAFVKWGEKIRDGMTGAKEATGKRGEKEIGDGRVKRKSKRR